MVKVAGIDAGSDPASCPNNGSIQCLKLQSVGNAKGPTGGSLLAKTTFIQRLNTRGGAVPTSHYSLTTDHFLSTYSALQYGHLAAQNGQCR